MTRLKIGEKRSPQKEEMTQAWIILDIIVFSRLHRTYSLYQLVDVKRERIYYNYSAHAFALISPPSPWWLTFSHQGSQCEMDGNADAEFLFLCIKLLFIIIASTCEKDNLSHRLLDV